MEHSRNIYFVKMSLIAVTINANGSTQDTPAKQDNQPITSASKSDVLKSLESTFKSFIPSIEKAQNEHKEKHILSALIQVAEDAYAVCSKFSIADYATEIATGEDDLIQWFKSDNIKGAFIEAVSSYEMFLEENRLQLQAYIDAHLIKAMRDGCFSCL